MRLFTFPKLLRGRYPGAIWEVENQSNAIYLTFDDGPDPEATTYVLDLLKEYQAKGTFFCLGKNIETYPEILTSIKAQGHEIANHGYAHLKGWKTTTKVYLDDVKKAKTLIDSNLFRPAYGKLSKGQFNAISELGFKTVFWSVISYDFDAELSSAKRRKKLIQAVKPGSILVFHDSQKALPQLKADLPYLLNYWKEKGYQFDRIKNPS